MAATWKSGFRGGNDGTLRPLCRGGGDLSRRRREAEPARGWRWRGRARWHDARLDLLLRAVQARFMRRDDLGREAALLGRAFLRRRTRGLRRGGLGTGAGLRRRTGLLRMPGARIAREPEQADQRAEDQRPQVWSHRFVSEMA